MHTLSIMAVLWAITVAAFTVLMVYRAHLTQHETEELFLNDIDRESVSSSHAEHDDIIRRVDQLRPYCQGFGGAAALLTAAIIGVWLVQVLPTISASQLR